ELAERHFYATAPEQPRAVLALARARFQTESDPDVPAAAADRLAEIGAIEEAVEASVLAAHALWRAGRLADGEAVLARAWSVLGDRTDTAAYAARRGGRPVCDVRQQDRRGRSAVRTRRRGGGAPRTRRRTGAGAQHAGRDRDDRRRPAPRARAPEDRDRLDDERDRADARDHEHRRRVSIRSLRR